MRLTLRTLLAYLDDTLEPAQARVIGQKVSESPVAQELVERIKKVTRRRGLANPPASGDGSKLDPNAVAEYLSDVLAADRTTEVEEICLTDDIYLAEVAACHQILTLMLSEPARVPPTARQRMYRLVKGRESIPYRKAAAIPGPEDAERVSAAADAGDETFLGLPTSGDRAGLLRWLAPFAGMAVIAAGLILAVTQALPRFVNQAPPVAQGPTPPAPTPLPTPAAAPEAAAEKLKAAAAPWAGLASSWAGLARSWGGGLSSLAQAPARPAAPPAVPAVARPPAGLPSPDRRDIGELTSTAVVVLARKPDPEGWQRVPTNGRAVGGERLVSLPGYTGELRLGAGVVVQLAGNLPERFGSAAGYPLYECEVTAYAPPDGLDADLALSAGRVHLLNRKGGPAAVRLRFENQAWDLTLPDAETEVVADVIAYYPPGTLFHPQTGTAEKPTVAVAVGVRRGKATVLPGGYREPITLAAGGDKVLLEWDNKGPGVEVLPDPLPFWGRRPEATLTPAEKAIDGEMRQALGRLHQRLTRPNTPPAVALAEARNSTSRSDRILAVFCLPALDALPELLDALDDAEHPEARLTASQALQHWIAKRPGNDQELYRVLTARKGYPGPLATNVVQLLLGFGESLRRRPEVFEKLIGLLGSDKLAVRQLAFLRLAELDAEGVRRLPFFDASGDADGRARAIDAWKKRIPEGQLPPAAPAAPAGGGPFRQGGAR